MGLLDAVLKSLKLNDNYDEERYDQRRYENDYETGDDYDDPYEERPDDRAGAKGRGRKERYNEKSYNEKPYKETRWGRSPESDRYSRNREDEDNAYEEKVVSISRKKKSIRGAVSQAVCIVHPREYEDSSKIASRLMEGQVILVDMKEMDPYVQQRFLDMLSGVIYVIKGTEIGISPQVFLFAPNTTEVDDLDIL